MPGAGRIAFCRRVFPPPRTKVRLIVLFIMMCVKDISRLKKDYPFYRPEHCQRKGCSSTKLWGHGFVELYIDGYEQTLWFRRWRCPVCGCIHMIRPLGYWLRHHTPVHIIVKGLCHRLTYGFWLKTLGPSRQRQQHWFRALRKNIKARLGMDFMGDLIGGLQELVLLPMVPVIRSG